MLEFGNYPGFEPWTILSRNAEKIISRMSEPGFDNTKADYRSYGHFSLIRRFIHDYRKSAADAAYYQLINTVCAAYVFSIVRCTQLMPNLSKATYHQMCAVRSQLPTQNVIADLKLSKLQTDASVNLHFFDVPENSAVAEWLRTCESVHEQISKMFDRWITCNCDKNGFIKTLQFKISCGNFNFHKILLDRDLRLTVCDHDAADYDSSLVMFCMGGPLSMCESVKYHVEPVLNHIRQYGWPNSNTEVVRT